MYEERLTFSQRERERERRLMVGFRGKKIAESGLEKRADEILPVVFVTSVLILISAVVDGRVSFYSWTRLGY